MSTESGAELDYRFPMAVSTQTKPVSDIAKGSTGQQEIINLAFVVTAMHCLGLSEAIMYLDEFGASFDQVHRSQAAHVVKSLVESQSFSQLFMISHYVHSYSAYESADVCVLCSNNITVPAVYNKHVTIE